ncbi:hypothetical protein QTG54_000654 [Skeletonema marinoi]|uniref:Nascent polypeptide-associated complex subunit alpha-like UBA domain-containing protein n=2 Tax=Skeletonema marinoi TaxID=267567 RepID=A0AAD8YP08_9STRA|nr:hypothetical protein QTG54_000654 [Skeletonema marinoi]
MHLILHQSTPHYIHPFYSPPQPQQPIIAANMTAEEEAKQLDSVTDRVQETELDESRSNQALSALNSAKSGSAAAASISVKKEDVDVIVAELEVTEDEATAALRDVAAEGGNLADALRRLVTS